jgi:hypothetical protein
LPNATPTPTPEVEVEDVFTEEEILAAAAAETLKAAGQHHRQLVNLWFSILRFFHLNKMKKYFCIDKQVKQKCRLSTSFKLKSSLLIRFVSFRKKF